MAYFSADSYPVSVTLGICFSSQRNAFNTATVIAVMPPLRSLSADVFSHRQLEFQTDQNHRTEDNLPSSMHAASKAQLNHKASELL